MEYWNPLLSFDIQNINGILKSFDIMSIYFFSVLAKCEFLPASSKDTPDEKKCDNPMKTDFGLQINGSVRCGFDA